MGWNSLIFLCNDAIGEIDKDPVGWWSKTKSELSHAHNNPVSYGFGNHVNGFEAVLEMHADTHALVAVGGNYTTVLWVGHKGNVGHHDVENQIDLLNAAAGELGYELKPLSKPKLTARLQRAQNDLAHYLGEKFAEGTPVRQVFDNNKRVARFEERVRHIKKLLGRKK